MTPEPAIDFVRSEYARERVHYKARQLARRRDFRCDDPADLEQELWLGLLRAADRYDPAKASVNTFVAQVLDSVAARLARERLRRMNLVARKRPPADGCTGPSPQADRIATSDRLRHRRVEPTDPLAAFDCREAVDLALSRLPADLRAIAVAIREHGRSEAARRFGLTRAGWRAAVQEIRKQLAKVNLERKPKKSHQFVGGEHT